MTAAESAHPDALSTGLAAPPGLVDAFWAYERALVADDLAAMDAHFDDSASTLRGDPGGLLVGHRQIHDFRAVRGGAPPRSIAELHVQSLGDGFAVVVAVTAPAGGGRGLQTQAWRRTPGGWRVTAAHVSSPPVSFDASVWRVVGDPLVPPLGSGPLDGETVAVKDLFAVAGQRIGAGVPAYLAQAEVQEQHSTAVRLLLQAGASVRGIARTDQLAYSLAGDNAHYGTPVNPAVPGALPGGSSSGSAVAVSLGAATIGLATDTAGSVRVPASYQGLWGLRTTHGAVPTDGLVPLATDFDTVGLLTRTPELLRRAAAALLPHAPARVPPSGDSGGDLAPERQAWFEAMAGPAVPADPGEVVALEHSGVTPFEEWAPGRGLGGLEVQGLAEAAEAFRVHQAYRAWEAHGRFLTAHPGALVGAAAARFEAASRVTEPEDLAALRVLLRWRARLEELLEDRVLVLPSAAAEAPRLWASAVDVDAARAATLRLTCIAGITGRPAVSAPLVSSPRGPMGVTFVGPPGSDLALLRLAASYGP